MTCYQSLEILRARGCRVMVDPGVPCMVTLYPESGRPSVYAGKDSEDALNRAESGSRPRVEVES